MKRKRQPVLALLCSVLASATLGETATPQTTIQPPPPPPQTDKASSTTLSLETKKDISSSYGTVRVPPPPPPRRGSDKERESPNEKDPESLSEEESKATQEDDLTARLQKVLQKPKGYTEANESIGNRETSSPPESKISKESQPSPETESKATMAKGGVVVGPAAESVAAASSLPIETRMEKTVNNRPMDEQQTPGDKRYGVPPPNNTMPPTNVERPTDTARKGPPPRMQPLSSIPPKSPQMRIHAALPQQNRPQNYQISQQQPPHQYRPPPHQHYPNYNHRQQQQQQQFRPPPRQYRPPAAKRSKPPNQMIMVKRFWTRIERGLDSLADVEDVLAGKAQQFYKQAKDTVTSRSSDDAPSNNDLGLQRLWSRQPKRRAKEPDVPPMDWSRFERKGMLAKQQQQQQTQSGTPNAQGASQPTTKAAPGTLSRKIDWTTFSSGENGASRMIRANGGASVPPQNPPDAAIATTWTATAQIDEQQPLRSPFANLAAPAEPRPTKRKFDFEDDDEKPSPFSRLASVLHQMPSLRLTNPFKRSSSYDMATLDAWKATDDASKRESKGFLGLFRRGQPTADTTTLVGHDQPKQIAEPLGDLMNRCAQGKKASLLTAKDRKECADIGRKRAITDVVMLVFLLMGCRQLPNLDLSLMPVSADEVVSHTIPGLVQSLREAMDSWAPLSFLAAFLAYETGKVITTPRSLALLNSLGPLVQQEAKYGVLFLRLFSGHSRNRKVPDAIQHAAESEARSLIDSSRLGTFVACMATYTLWQAVPLLQELLGLGVGFLAYLISLDLWRSWPLQWRMLGAELMSASSLLLQHVKTAVVGELSIMKDDPLRFVFVGSLVVSLLAVSVFSGLGRESELAKASLAEDLEDDIDTEVQRQDLTVQVSNLGVSSAARLSLLSDSGGIDAALERWRFTASSASEDGRSVDVPLLLKLAFRSIITSLILFLPLLIYGHVGILPRTSTSVIRMDSLLDLSLLLLLTGGMTLRALSTTSVSNRSFEGIVTTFLSAVSSAVTERVKRSNTQPADLHLQASISSSAGVSVQDLWAAHTTKRAWALRGATFSCRSGEVVLVLGDDSSGKSRLLTTMSESILDPPNRARSANKVRGVVTIGGLDVSKWDSSLLRRRVGILLNDVRTASDFGQMLSGLSLDEILEPTGGVRNFELSHNPGSKERSCMMLALKITGLYYTLLPQLPSKMATVVTTNEEDTVSPLFQILSPAEWARLLLARVLSQAVYDNENAAGTNSQVENSLMGSVLLLDDATTYFSEVDEAKFFGELRKTGAASVVTSSRWATGRHADRIVVMRSGAIVETGTHSELLSRGPQQSIYAAKWHAMTSSS